MKKMFMLFQRKRAKMNTRIQYSIFIGTFNDLQGEESTRPRQSVQLGGQSLDGVDGKENVKSKNN